MRNQFCHRILGLLLIALVIFICCTPELQRYFSLPSEQRLAVGDQLLILNHLPKNVLSRLTVSLQDTSEGILGLNGEVIQRSFSLASGNPVALQPGRTNLQFRLFGFIPIKKMVVDVVPPLRLIPGGHSIGVLLHGEGVVVIGFSPIKDISGKLCDPAQDSGIQIGDVIVSVNGQTINSDDEVAYLIDKLGQENQEAHLVIRHNETMKEIFLKPHYCTETKRWRIGLYVKDGAAGVGTLTFYDPDTRQYGALGHIISDADSNQAIEVKGGRIVAASVEGIQPGRRGQPGEKIGMFLDNQCIRGTIEKNSRYGIFGKLNTDLINSLYTQPLPVALASQVKEGDAQILTVINGEQIESFAIKIERVLPFRTDGKSLVIRVVDQRLLSLTGGIIQGMSGSPIIQDGRLVGAVTHVFVNDPSRGYGVLLEFMLKEMDYLKNRVSLNTGEVFFFPGLIYERRIIIYHPEIKWQNLKLCRNSLKSADFFFYY